MLLKKSGNQWVREREREYQYNVLSLDINLQVKRELGGPSGDGTGAVGIGANEINGDGKVDVSYEVSQEEKSSGGHANEDRWWWVWIGGATEIGGDLGGQVADAARDLVLVPQDSLNVRL